MTFSGVRAWEELTCGVLGPSFLPGGSRFLRSFPNVSEAGSLIHNPTPTPVFLGVAIAAQISKPLPVFPNANFPSPVQTSESTICLPGCFSNRPLF